MLQIRETKPFKKEYKKLSKCDQKRVDEAILAFAKNPSEKKLRNHALKGRLAGQWSISAGYDLRIIYQKDENGEKTTPPTITIILLRVGSHNQVY